MNARATCRAVLDRDPALARAARAASALGDALCDLSLPHARAVLRVLIEKVDDAREQLELEAGLADVLTVYETVPETPDFLKTRADWRRDLWNAWRALGEADRASFLRWAMRGRRAAA